MTLRKDIEAKFKQDFSQRTAGEYEKFVLFCTAHLTAKQKLDFINFCAGTLQAELVPTDIEALRSLLDSALTPIRDRYLYLSDQEKQRRSVLLGKFRRLWILSNDGISPGMMAGTTPLPKEWVERQLEAMGETWRQDIYSMFALLERRGDKKGHHVVSRRKTTLETMEVSDATAYYMPG